MLPKTIEIAGALVTLRDAGVDDVGYIFSTWMEAARQLRQTRRAVFNQFYENVVRGLIESESVIALTTEGGSALHAWACGRPPNLLHFAYVPHGIRGQGFGRAVIESVLGAYPSTVYVTSSPLSIRDHRRLVYNPYVMRAG